MEKDYLKEAIISAIKGGNEIPPQYEDKINNLDFKNIDLDVDKPFCDKLTDYIKQWKAELKKLQSLTPEELETIVNDINNKSMDYVDNHNKKARELATHIQGLIQKVDEWDVDNELINMKDAIKYNLTEALVYQCVQMETPEILTVEKYLENETNRLKENIEHRTMYKKIYVKEVKKAKKLFNLLGDKVPELIK